MYSKSPLISQRSTLASLVSRVSQLGTSSTSGALGEKSSLSFPLFDFVQVASASGLKQYPPDIAEEGLVVASLGDGADYVVDKVRSTDGDIVVVKHVKATFAIGLAEHRGNEDSRIRKVLHEIKIATHPALKKNVNILQTRGFGWELGEGSVATPFVVVEYAEYGTLRDYLRKDSNSISIETKYDLALDAAKGIQTLHAHHIAHGDLKLENALITSTPRNPTLKISDFGHSVVLEDDRKSYEYWGTEKYRPPEVTEQTGGSDTAGFIAGSQYRACDTYAYGLLVLELLIDGEQYFEGTVDLSQGEERFEPQQRLSTVDSESNTTISTLKHVAEECLLVEADGRPQMVEIVSQLGSVERAGEVDDVAPLTRSELASSADIHNFGKWNQFPAALTHEDLDNDPAQLVPWKVQELITEGFRQQSQSRDPRIASQASLQLASCHYVGFGVERDHAQILRFIDEAATYGCFEARRIRNQLYRAFSVPLCPLDVLFRVDELGERQLQYLQEAELQNADVNAFQVFDDVAQEDFRSRLSTTMISLHHAAYIGDLGRVRHLLDSQQDFQDEKGRTALFWAVKGRQMGAMRLLLDVGGGDPQIADEDGHTPVHMLIMFSNLEVEAALSRMLELSRNLDLDRYSPTPLDASEHWAELWGAPLHWAVLAGNKAMVSCLVKAGARVHGWPEESCPVRIAASLHLSEILEILLSAIPHESAILGTNPLFALTSGDPFRRLMLHGKDYITEIDRTVALLANRYPVVAEDGGPWNGNPLRELLVSNFSDSDRYIAKALVAAGAAEDPYNGLTLLQSAIIGCHGSPASSVCRMALDMIEVEDDLRRRSTDHRQGWTALHWAAAGGMVPVADKLLRLDPESINLRTEEDEDRTPLHLAAEAGKSIDMIRLLLRHGADASSTTSGLKLTPLGSFISNQRSELNSEILTVLLRASRDNGYLVMRSDSWNVLHFGATRAALLDAESLPGHILLRTFATIPEVRELAASTTAQGWTPLQLASYMVDYSTIKVLVEDFGADVQAATPNGARPFDIVLERGRRFPTGLRGADSLVRWSRLAFRSALFLQEQLEALEGPLYLTPLHIATYIGHQREVERLVRTKPQAVFETNWEGETPREMLQNTLPSQVDEEWAATFCRIATSVLKYLDEKELELEEDLEQSGIDGHRSQE